MLAVSLTFTKFERKINVFRVSPANPSDILLSPSHFRMLHDISSVFTTLFSSKNTLSKEIPEKSKYTSIYIACNKCNLSRNGDLYLKILTMLPLGSYLPLSMRFGVLRR